MRLFLHVGAYWLMWSLRRLMPRRSSWRIVQFDTLRLRLLKLAARVEVLKRCLRLHLPRATPDQASFVLALTRMPRLTIWAAGPPPANRPDPINPNAQQPPRLTQTPHIGRVNRRPATASPQNLRLAHNPG